MPARLALIALLGLVACAPPPSQLILPAPESALEVRPVVRSISVRDITLPRNAASDEVVYRRPDGVLDPVRDLVWADAPERAMTLAFTESLAAITGARVAAEPWPFRDPPAAEVTVRVRRFDGGPGGAVMLAGQYAIAAVDSELADRDGRFDIAVPVAGEDGRALAQAMARATAELAETVARRLAR